MIKSKYRFYSELALLYVLDITPIQYAHMSVLKLAPATSDSDLRPQLNTTNCLMLITCLTSTNRVAFVLSRSHATSCTVITNV